MVSKCLQNKHFLCPLILRSYSSSTTTSNSSSNAVRPTSSTTTVFPDVEAKTLSRGTGGRSSFNGQIVTVFGAGGFLGRYVVNRLAKVGSQIVVPFRGDLSDCFPLKLCGDLGQVVFTHFHLKNHESVHKALKHSNVVINLIGKDCETNRFSFADVHIEGARTIARLAREAGVKRLVHVSALNVTPTPEPHLLWGGSRWLRSKYWGEMAVREEFPDAVVIRPADIHGTDDNWGTVLVGWQRRQLGKLPLWRGGFGTFKQPVHVSDVASAIANAVGDEEAPGRVFQALGPRRYEMRAICEYLNRVMQKHPDNGFRVTNIRWSPLYLLRVLCQSHPQWLHKYPMVTLEKLERETISDFPDPTLPTIKDLGVKLTYMEDKMEYDLIHWRHLANYAHEAGEFPEHERAPTVPAL